MPGGATVGAAREKGHRVSQRLGVIEAWRKMEFEGREEQRAFSDMREG